MAVTHKRRVEVFNGEGVSVVFVLHRVRNEYKVNHLGLYVIQGDGLSTDVHGLIGKVYEAKDVYENPRYFRI